MADGRWPIADGRSTIAVDCRPSYVTATEVLGISIFHYNNEIRVNEVSIGHRPSTIDHRPTANGQRSTVNGQRSTVIDSMMMRCIAFNMNMTSVCYITVWICSVAGVSHIGTVPRCRILVRVITGNTEPDEHYH
jgi:hypothetical protein